MILNDISNTYSRGDVYSGSSSHWRCRNITRKMKLLLSNIKIYGWWNSFIIEDKMWLVCRCFSLFQFNFGFGIGTQALPRNRGAYVSTQNWHKTRFAGNLGEPVRPVIQSGQTGQDNFVKLSIGLHHCVDLVETIEMHIYNVQFGLQMRKLCLPEDLHPGLTGQTGPGAVRPVRNAQFELGVVF